MEFLKKGKKIIAIIMTLVVVLTGMYICAQRHGDVMWTSAPDFAISAGQAILVDGDTGRVLYEKAADQRAYPASTTKIMTALLTLEILEKYDSPLDQKVEIPAEAEGVEGSSLYLKAGEKISIEDLLYGMMLVSGNDSAVALSCIIGGTQQHFIEMMNRRADAIGCTGTHFTNPNGLFDEDHYTTARDLANITRTAMKNKTVRQFDGGNGVKIGYTKASGRTLAASATRDGKNIICVVMSAPDWFQDAYRLMEYGFDVL